MIKVDGLSIAISRGDTGALTLRLKGETPEDGTPAIITLKRNISNQIAEWVKNTKVVDGCVVMELDSTDTNRRIGKYYWDVRLLIGEKVITPFLPQVFMIEGAVGDV